MFDFAAYKASEICYWEKRRIFYNLALIPPTLFGYLLRSELSAAIGDQPRLTDTELWLCLAICGIGANICYSFVYVLSFFLTTERMARRWQGGIRVLVFISGTFFALGVAFFMARELAAITYP